MLFLKLALVATSAFAANTHNAIKKRHTTTFNHAKRFSNAPATFYVINDGNQVACGGFYQPSDFVFALNAAMFGDGSSCCGKSATLSYQGKTTTAQCVDECMGCAPEGIDLTEGLFSFFVPNDPVAVGEISLTWNFGGDSAPPAPPPPPKTTTKHTTTHTSTSATPTPTPSTTSHHTTHTTTSSTSTSTSKSTSSSTSSSTTSTSTTAAATPTGAGNLAELFQGIMDLSKLTADAASVESKASS